MFPGPNPFSNILTSPFSGKVPPDGTTIQPTEPVESNSLFGDFPLSTTGNEQGQLPQENVGNLKMKDLTDQTMPSSIFGGLNLFQPLVDEQNSLFAHPMFSSTLPSQILQNPIDSLQNLMQGNPLASQPRFNQGEDITQKNYTYHTVMNDLCKPFYPEKYMPVDVNDQIYSHSKTKFIQPRQDTLVKVSLSEDKGTLLVSTDKFEQGYSYKGHEILDFDIIQLETKIVFVTKEEVGVCMISFDNYDNDTFEILNEKIIALTCHEDILILCSSPSYIIFQSQSILKFLNLHECKVIQEISIQRKVYSAILYRDFCCISYENNEIQCINLKSGITLFKSSLRDLAGKLSKFYHIDPEAMIGDGKVLSSEVKEGLGNEVDELADVQNRVLLNQEIQNINEEDEEDMNRFIDDEVVDDEEDESHGEHFSIPSIEMGANGAFSGSDPSGLGGVRKREKRLQLFQSATAQIQRSAAVSTVPQLSNNSLQLRVNQHQSKINQERNPQSLSGFFLFIETSTSSINRLDSFNSQNDASFNPNHLSMDPQKQPQPNFEKIHLVKIKHKNNENKLIQTSTLKISDKSPKITQFDQQNGVLFILNTHSSQNGTFVLHIVQLKFVEKDSQHHFSESEEEALSPGKKGEKLIGIKLNHIRKVLLVVTDSHKDFICRDLNVQRENDSVNQSDCYNLMIVNEDGSCFSFKIPHSEVKPEKVLSPLLGFQPPNFSQLNEAIKIQSSLAQTQSFGKEEQKEEQMRQDHEQLEDFEQDNETEDVKKELNEAIEKELQLPKVIQDLRADNDEFLQSEETDFMTTPLGQKTQLDKIEKTSKPAGGEIRVTPELFNKIKASNAAPTTSTTASKKKKKQKEKKAQANGAEKGGQVTPTNQKSRPPSPDGSKPSTVQRIAEAKPQTIMPQQPVIVQTLKESASQKQLEVTPQRSANAPNPVAQVMPQQQTTSKKTKAIQEQLLENFTELTKKYQELSQKFQKVQDQLTNQQTHQIEVERTINQNLQKYLPQAVEQQMKEIVVPMVLNHVKSLDKKVKEEIMPQVESQLQDVVQKIVKQNKLIFDVKGGQDKDEKSKLLDGDTQNMIRELIVEEFSEAMESQIKPMLQTSLVTVVKEVQNSLSLVSKEFTTMLNQEEDNNKTIIEQLSQKVEQLQSDIAQNSPGSFSQMPNYYNQNYQYPPPPLPFYPPYYPQYVGHPNPYHPPPPPFGNHHSHGWSLQGSQPQVPQKIQSKMNSTSQQIGMKDQLIQPKNNQGSQQLYKIQSDRAQQMQPTMVNQWENPYYQQIAYYQMQPPYGHARNFPMYQQNPYQRFDESEGEEPINENIQELKQPQTMQKPQLPGHPSSEIQNKTQSLPKEQQLGVTFSFNPTQFTGTVTSNNKNIGDNKEPSQPPRAQNSVKAFKLSNDQKVLYFDENEDDTVEDSHVQKQSSYQSQNQKATNQSPALQQVASSSASSDHNQSAKTGASQLYPSAIDPFNASGQKDDSSKINWQFLPFIKDIATKAKLNQADFLLCGSEQFLKDAILTVQNNSRIITNQYKGKIIHQFIKKIYQRAKDYERARIGALQIINVFIEKIYKERPEMKQAYFQQALQWEEEIRKLVQF